MDLKFSFPLIFWLILRMIQEKHWEYNAMATESLESTACDSERETGGSVRVCWRSIKRGRINVCVLDLLYSERGADFLSSEDYGALSQDFRQLEGVQAQQLTGISDHWKMDKDALHFCNAFIEVWHFPNSLCIWTDLAWWWSALLLQSWTRCFPTARLLTAA